MHGRTQAPGRSCAAAEAQSQPASYLFRAPEFVILLTHAEHDMSFSLTPTIPPMKAARLGQVLRLRAKDFLSVHAKDFGVGFRVQIK